MAVRTHPFAPNARERPGKTPVRTALSPRYLIRMKSEVQVLPGPPKWPLTSGNANPLSLGSAGSDRSLVSDEDSGSSAPLSPHGPLTSTFAGSSASTDARVRSHSGWRAHPLTNAGRWSGPQWWKAGLGARLVALTDAERRRGTGRASAVSVVVEGRRPRIGVGRYSAVGGSVGVPLEIRTASRRRGCVWAANDAPARF